MPCSQALALLHHSMPKLNKKKAQTLQIVFYKALHIQEPTTTKHRYTAFSSDASGNLTHKSKSLFTHSHTMPRNAEEGPTNTLNLNPLNCNNSVEYHEDQMFTDPLFDTAYVEHLEEINADAKIKRVRPKGVRQFSILAFENVIAYQ